MKTIYIFGNELLDFDNLPLKILPNLQKKFPEINFKIQDPNENLKPINKEIHIIDTVQGIKEVKTISSLNQLNTNSSLYSLHDLDLAFNLKLLKKLGLLKKVIIFAVPQNISKKKALAQLCNKLTPSLKP